jgi:hypothetical protein
MRAGQFSAGSHLTGVFAIARTAHLRADPRRGGYFRECIIGTTRDIHRNLKALFPGPFALTNYRELSSYTSHFRSKIKNFHLSLVVRLVITLLLNSLRPVSQAHKIGA